MSEPYPLYVDEISPDAVKAVVSDKNSVFTNLASIRKASTRQWEAHIHTVISGVLILPVGRFICLVSRSPKGEAASFFGNLGMILLDLTGREEMGYAIAGRFHNKELEERFIDVLTDVVWNKAHHEQFRLVVGKSPRNIFR
jgi:hypothetical protein